MPLSMPAAPGVVSSKFGLEQNSLRFTSPMSNASQRLLLGGARWTMTVTLPQMNRPQFANWQSFLLQCEGGVNTFYGFDPDARTPRGVATGTPLVKLGSQTGSTLNVDGCTANITGWLKAGDYFSVNGELKMVTADCNTNGSGETTISFKPALRNSPADNAPLTVTNAACEMVMIDDTQGMWQSGRHLGVYEQLTFSAVEVF